VISEGGELVKKQVSLLELSLWGAYATVGRLHRRGVRFVAAAGNDRQKAISMFVPTPPKPAAAYPAALPDVIGVAALDRVGVGMNPKATDYSNLADKPAMEGVAVFGGKTDRFNYTVSDQGVNGLYIGSLPPDVNGNPQINDEGWAEWAGTSFAAPIITAMLAMDAATGIPLDTAISNLFNQSPRSTQDNEPIIEVTK
jgi:subtilisin family serine protease